MATNNIKDFRFSIYINNEAARKSLVEMEQLSDKYTAALARLAEAGKTNTAEYAQTKKKLDQVKEAMTDLSKQAGLTSLSLSQLTSLKKALNHEFARAIPGTAHWEKLKADIQTVNNRMTQLRIQNNQTGLSLAQLAEGVNRYIGLITMAVASLTGIVLGIRKTIDAYAEWDDKLSDVMKTTGLTKDQVKALNGELAKINTRSSQMELLDLARVAGKLGINAVQDVKDFVTAANQIKVALTEDLGGDVEESIRQVGKLVEIFKLKDRFGIEQSLLKVGSAVNALGAASTANEGYMVEFAKRVAGVAPMANISIQKVLGLAATLDQLGQTSEVSSTVFAAVIPDMFKDTGKYADIAGMSVKDFSKLLSRDANGAFIKFLEGLNGNNGGLAEMADKLDGLGLEGKRSISVLGVLADNTKMLKEQQALANQEFYKGTSITQEYTTKNNNAMAELEKARKGFQAMAVELGEKLAPAMTFSTSGLSYFLKTLKLTIEFVSEHKRGLTTLAVAIVAYTVVVKALALAEAWRNREGKIGIVITKAKMVAESSAIIVTQAFAAATMLLTGNIKGATQAIRVMNTAIKGSPWGWLAAAVAGVISYLVIFREESDKASKFTEYYTQALERNTEQLVAEQTEFQGLIRQAMAANEGTELRKRLIDELNQKYPGYLDHIQAEMISNESLAVMLDKVNTVYKEKFKLLQINARMEAIQKQYTDKEVEKMKLEQELAKLRKMALTEGTDESKRERQIKTELNLIGQEQKLMEANMALIQNKANQVKQDMENLTNPSIAILEARIKELTKMEKIFQERADKAAPPSLQEQFPGYQVGDEIPKDAVTSTPDQDYYLQQKAKVQNEKAEAEQQLIYKQQKQQKKKKTTSTITTDNDITVTNGKVDPADKKAMLKAKKAEQKAWDDLEKLLDKELEDADKGGTGKDTESLKLKESKSETDALYQEQANLANRLRDLNYQQTEEERIEEEKRIEFKRKAMEIKQQLEEQSLQAASQSLGNIASLFDENTAAYKITASLKAVVDTYMAANVALASAPPPFNYILMATTIATGLANVAKINAIQFAEGRYPVTGASNGRTYQAGYQSKATTGLYTRPTLLGNLGLVGEKGNEIVISNPHVRHLQMNYPEVISTIYRTAVRVPQFAQGNYPAAGSGAAAPAGQQKNNGKEDLMIELLQRIAASNEKPLRAYIPYNDLNDTFNEVEGIEKGLK